MNYLEMDYRDLKVECAKRDLGGAGKKAELSIDGKVIGSLISESVSGLDLRRVATSKTFYVDDVEIFCALTF